MIWDLLLGIAALVLAPVGLFVVLLWADQFGRH